jgi:hypothetical protein
MAKVTVKDNRVAAVTKAEYLQRQATSFIKKGDRVRVVRKARGHEGGWDNVWVDSMDCLVGKVRKVRGVTELGIQLRRRKGEAPFSFPYFVLQVVNDYKTRQANSGIKVGDTVKVLRKATDYEHGWPNVWAASRMDGMVGGTYKVESIARGGIRLKSLVDGIRWSFPYFVLEAVPPRPPVVIKGYTVEILADRIKVGCVEADFATVEAIYKRIKGER